MLFAVVVALGGLGLMAAFLVPHRRAERSAIDELLGMVPRSRGRGGGETERGAEAVELDGLAGRAADLAGQVVDQVDRRRSLGLALERARIPLRPGEFVDRRPPPPAWAWPPSCWRSRAPSWSRLVGPVLARS